MGGKRKRGANKAGGVSGQPSQKRSKPDEPATNGAQSTPLDLDNSPFADENTGENRKREAKIYDLLGSLDNDERLAAADALITGLLAGSEPALKRHLEKRLFRGLASSRNASRLGFSLVITEILRQLFGSSDVASTKFPGLTFDKVLSILVDATSIGGNVPGQEERDYFFGRLFGIQCFVEAKILFADSTRWPKLLELLLDMAQKKVWIRSHCGWVIVECLPQMGQERAEAALRGFADQGLGKTAEGVGIWLRARSCYPGIKLPAKPWVDPLSPVSLPEVARVLKENVANDNGEDAAVPKLKQSNWTAQLHFVWDLILATLLESSATDKKSTKDQVKLFWTTVIDDGLFSKNASDGQKFRGFMLFQKYIHGLASVDKSLVKELFTRNLMKCLINQAAKEDRYLHRAALKTLQSMEKAVETHPELLVIILKELIGKYGLYDFDQRTASKTIENLLQWVTPNNSKKVLKLLREPVMNLKDVPEDAEKLRQAYADYIFKMTVQVKMSATDSKDADSKSALEIGVKELISCAYSLQEEFTPQPSDKTRDIFRNRLASAFSKVAKQSQNAEYLCDAVRSVKPTAVAMNNEIEVKRKDALKAMAKLLEVSKKSGDSSGNLSTGLALLYSATLLQLYNGAPDAFSILEDIEACSEKVKSKEAGASELLIEILFALIPRQSPMLRQISEQVFDAFASQISSEALQLLLEPLVAEENSKGYQALFENNEDADMEDIEESNSGSDDADSDEDEISEVGSDVEFVTLNDADTKSDGDAEEDQNENQEEKDEEENEAEDADLAALDDALAKVLNSHRLDKDQEAESSDNDSDMTDSEMMALDEKLVDVFKHQIKNTKRKSEKKDAKESVVLFKHRILDLLNIFVKQEASNVLAFDLLLPLMELVRTTTVKPLSNKAMNILTDFSKASKKIRSKDTQVDTEAQVTLLLKIHEEASKDMSHAFAKAASMASLLIASSLWAADQENIDRINAVYAQTFADCQKGKIKIQGAFFSDWINWGMGHANNQNAGE
ncbi:DNA polymerase phi-domain-containing protein [Xylaria bambusicola]|uniref:DNA polymerase phi-domain-containing protein n=1 Tax=Xylaria bambusicola TaxID=326684 RepID=UPI002007AB50|nr:DNA polymerase phi-domain-containing protein [Xylaria bambusicola]KAI0508628.1 DNA polymerase phi-domain-containing protein [Xylaria bambusicola]